MINPLEVPDRFHVEAAQGWLELGNHLEANEELETILSFSTEAALTTMVCSTHY
jgi:hypothetical protein